MNTPQSQIVVDRFFIALDRLKQDRRIRGYATFCKRYGINRMNLWSLKQDHARGYFQAEWLTHLVEDYGISADWLLTGKE